MSDLEGDRLSIPTAVAGVSYRQEAVSRCHEGQTVRLVRDPSNAHDENAIEVHTNEQIGFIPRDLAETLALYLDYSGQDVVEARVDSLIGRTDEEPNIGVVIDIVISETLYNIVEEDPDFIRRSIVSEKTAAAINASLTDDEVRKYIQNMDDGTLDTKYWFVQQSKWEEEQKEKARRRLGRELGSYEEGEIEEKAEAKFEKYSKNHAVTSHDRQKIRDTMSRQDVVYSILADQDLREMEEEINEKIENEQIKENKNIALGLVILFVFMAIVMAIFVS